MCTCFKTCIIKEQLVAVINIFLLFQEIIAQGDTVRTIVKFLSNAESKEREEAVSLLYELSKSEALCEKIGSVNGAILILVGMASSKSENLLAVEMADSTLENLEVCENNVRQMAENGRLQPLLRLLLEGTSLDFSLGSGLLMINSILHFSQEKLFPRASGMVIVV